MLLDQMLYYLGSHRDFSARSLQYTYPFLYALPPSALAPYQLSDLVAEWTHDYIVEKDGTSCSFFYAIKSDFDYGSLWPENRPSDTLRNIFNSEMFDASGNMIFSHPKSVALLSCLHNLSDWGTWMPSVDIYMLHEANDDWMPYGQAKTFYENKSSSGKMHWKDVHTGLLGQTMGTHQAFTLISSLNMMLYSLPSQAFKH